MLRQIWVLAMLAGLPAATLADTYGVDQIVASYRDKADRITTIAVDVSGTTVPLVTPEELFRDFHIIPADGTRLSLIYHRDGRLRVENSAISTVVHTAVLNRLMKVDPSLVANPDGVFATPYEKVRSLSKEILAEHPKPILRSIVFDGAKLWEYDSSFRIVNRGVEQRVFNVVKPERFADGMLYRTLLEDLLLTCDLPGLPNEAVQRRANLLPELVSGGKFRIADQPEDVDGHRCVVLESEAQRISLDPALGFAVRRRQWFSGGVLTMEVIARDFERLADNLWFPRSLGETLFAEKNEAGGRFAGRAYLRNETTVTRVELNRPEHVASLSVSVPAGSWISDQTLTPLDEKGRPVAATKLAPNTVPSVSYVVPAERADLDRAIQEAQASAGRRILGSPSKRSILWTVLAFNAGLLAIFLVGYAYEVRRRRRVAVDGQGPV